MDWSSWNEEIYVDIFSYKNVWPTCFGIQESFTRICKHMPSDTYFSLFSFQVIELICERG